MAEKVFEPRELANYSIKRLGEEPYNQSVATQGIIAALVYIGDEVNQFRREHP